MTDKADIVDRVAAVIATEWWRQEISRISEDFWELQPEQRKRQWRNAVRAGLAVLGPHENWGTFEPRIEEKPYTWTDKVLISIGFRR